MEIKKMVSVIVPVYNSEAYLDRCVQSIVGQTYKNIEIVLINDGSTDKSGKMCDEYSLQDSRIKAIHQKNGGPAAARNEGIKRSSGEFIFFLDADDFIENNAISLLVENYNRSDADMIVGDFKKINNGIIQNRNDISFLSDQLLDKKDLVDYAKSYLKRPNKYLLFAFSWGRLFKSSIIKNNNILFDVNLYTFEDVAFNFDYLNYVNAMYFIKESILSHTIYTNYSSATMTIGDDPEKLFGYKRALINIGNFLKDSVTEDDIKKEIGHADVYLTIIQLVRVCGQINQKNKRTIRGLIKGLVNDLNFRINLKYYLPTKGDSRILPMLMRLKLVWPIILVCRHKARKRYR